MRYLALYFCSFLFAYDPYYEMLVHVPLLSHGHAQSVLLLDDPDGKALDELLRYTDLAITVVGNPNPERPTVHFTTPDQLSGTFDVIISPSPCDGKGQLNPGGIFVSPMQPQSDFKYVKRFLAPDHENFTFLQMASDSTHKVSKKALKERLKQLSGQMEYYTPDIHRASLLLAKKHG